MVLNFKMIIGIITFERFQKSLTKILRVIYSTKAGVVIWYAIYCPNMNEYQLIHSLKQHLSQTALKDAFVLTYDRMRRYEGAWHVEKLPMFPRYLFLESEDEICLTEELKQYEGIIQMPNKNDAPIRLRSNEERLLRELCGPKHHMGISKGVIRGGITEVTEGPLKGKETMISRIDRHKRLARLKGFGNDEEKAVVAGLEILSKS